MKKWNVASVGAANGECKPGCRTACDACLAMPSGETTVERADFAQYAADWRFAS